MTGGGTLDIDGNTTFTGTVAASAADIASGQMLTLQGDANITTIDGSGSLALESNFTTTGAIGGNATLDTITLADGKQLTINHDVNASTLSLAGSGSIALVASDATLNTNITGTGKLQVSANAQMGVGKTIHVGTLEIQSDGNLTTGGDVNASNGIQLTGVLTTGAEGTITGAISAGSGTLAIQHNTTMDGDIGSNASALENLNVDDDRQFSTNSNIYADTIALNESGTLQMTGSNKIVDGNVTGNGTLDIDGSTTFTGIVSAGSADIADGQTLTLEGNSSITMIDGPGSLALEENFTTTGVIGGDTALNTITLADSKQLTAQHNVTAATFTLGTGSIFQIANDDLSIIGTIDGNGTLDIDGNFSTTSAIGANTALHAITLAGNKQFTVNHNINAGSIFMEDSGAVLVLNQNDLPIDSTIDGNGTLRIQGNFSTKETIGKNTALDSILVENQKKLTVNHAISANQLSIGEDASLEISGTDQVLTLNQFDLNRGSELRMLNSLTIHGAPNITLGENTALLIDVSDLNLNNDHDALEAITAENSTVTLSGTSRVSTLGSIDPIKESEIDYLVVIDVGENGSITNDNTFQFDSDEFSSCQKSDDGKHHFCVFDKTPNYYVDDKKRNYYIVKRSNYIADIIVSGKNPALKALMESSVNNLENKKLFAKATTPSSGDSVAAGAIDVARSTGGQVATRMAAKRANGIQVAGLSAGEAFRKNMWGKTFYISNQQDGAIQEAGSYDAYLSTGQGLMMGTDRWLENGRTQLGGAVGYTHSNVDESGIYSTDVTTDSWQVSAYGTHEFDPFYVEGVIAYTLNQNDQQRESAGETLNANYNSHLYSLSGAIGKNYQFGNSKRHALNIEPKTGLYFSHLEIEPYAESGGDLALHVAQEAIDTLELNLSSNFASTVQTGSGAEALVELRLGTSRELLDRRTNSHAAFVYDPATAVSVTGMETPDDTIHLGIGAGYRFTNDLELRADYNHHRKQGYRSDHGSFTAKMKF